MSERIELGSITKGSWGEDVDNWHLVVEDDGKMHVQHRWTHENPYKGGKVNRGEDRLSIEEFLSSGSKENIKAKLREVVAQRSG